AVPGPLDPLEVAGRDDQVRVHIAPVEHGRAAAVGHERFHEVLVMKRFTAEDAEGAERGWRGKGQRTESRIQDAQIPEAGFESPDPGRGVGQTVRLSLSDPPFLSPSGTSNLSSGIRPPPFALCS